MTTQPEPTEAAGPSHPYDPGNVDGLAFKLPVNVQCFVRNDVPGHVGITVRCGGTTLTFTLSKEECLAFASSLQASASKTSGLIVPNGVMPS